MEKRDGPEPDPTDSRLVVGTCLPSRRGPEIPGKSEPTVKGMCLSAHFGPLVRLSYLVPQPLPSRPLRASHQLLMPHRDTPVLLPPASALSLSDLFSLFRKVLPTGHLPFSAASCKALVCVTLPVPRAAGNPVEWNKYRLQVCQPLFAPLHLCPVRLQAPVPGDPHFVRSEVRTTDAAH